LKICFKNNIFEILKVKNPILQNSAQKLHFAKTVRIFCFFEKIQKNSKWQDAETRSA